MGASRRAARLWFREGVFRPEQPRVLHHLPDASDLSRAPLPLESKGRTTRAAREMTERHVFADVDLPFHVWVKEGNRWVLRSRGAEAPGDEVNARGEAPRSSTSATPARR